MDKSKRDQIMDVAEKLFAQSGYHGVSVRDITSAANVRLASVNYYFETKHNLYLEIFMRRAVDILQERQAGLNAIGFENLSKREAIEQIVHAYTDPLLKRVMAGDSGWRAYFSVLANHTTLPLADDQAAPEMNEYDVSSVDYIDALSRFVSSQDERKAHNAFQFLIGSMLTMFANNGRSNTLSQEKFKSNEYESIYQDGMDFMVAGVVRVLLGD